MPFYLRCYRVAAAAWENVNTLVAYLPSPKLACRHSFRFTLARFVSFNYLPTHRKTWNRVWTYAFLFSWSLVTHSETFVNGGSSYHCHSHLSLRSKSTILPNQQTPARDDRDAAAWSVGEASTVSLHVVAAKDGLRMRGASSCLIGPI